MALSGSSAPDLHREVRFAPDFVPRLERLVARARRRRDAGEGERRAAWATGAGAEFAGYRPYRPGEDLRRLDWNLLARLDRPFVRVTRAESGADWLVLLDTSASMAVGPPGKLQRAAEVAAALCALGTRLGARVRIVTAAGPAADAARGEHHAAAREHQAGKGGALAGVLRFLGEQRAGGRDEPLERVLVRPRARWGTHGAQVFVLGDLWTQDLAALLALARHGRALTLIRILAPVELEPGEVGPVEWSDPESGARLALVVDAQARARYARELDLGLERWRTACAERGVACGVFSSAQDFEDILFDRRLQR